MSGSQVYSFARGENPLRADKLNGAFAERVLRSGDTMTGALMLHGLPSTALEAATKAYVDGIATGSITPGSNLVSVKAMGAAGNNVTDDIIPIRAAYTNAALLGYVVYYPAGKYKVSGDINAGGVSSVGDGPTVSVIVRGNNATLTNGLLNYSGAQNFQVKDLGFDGNAANNTTFANGLYLDSCMDCVVENVHSDNNVKVGSDPSSSKGQGIAVFNTPITSPSGRGVQFRNCECCFNGGAGLFIYAQGINISVLGGVFSFNSASGVSFAEKNVEYVGGTIINPKVANTRCDYNTHHGIIMNGFSVFRNGINCSGHGNDPCVGAVVQGNQCNHNSAYGMLLQATGLTVICNTCNYNGLIGPSTLAGIDCTSESFVVLGNECVGNAPWGIDVGGSWKGTVSHNISSKNTLSTGVSGTGLNLGACQDVTVSHNVFEDNTQQAIHFSLNDSGGFYFPWDTINLTITNNIIINTISSSLFGILGGGLVSGVIIEDNTIYWPVDTAGLQCIQCNLGPNSRIARNHLANLDSDVAVVLARAPQLSVPQWADQILLQGGAGPIADIVAYPQIQAAGHCTQIKMVTRGSGYTSDPVVTVTGGTWGNDDITGLPDPPQFVAHRTQDGQIAACTIKDAGSHVVGPVTVSITGGGGSGATAVVAVGAPPPYGRTLIMTCNDTPAFRLQQSPTLQLNMVDGALVQTAAGMSITLQWRATAWFLVAMAGMAVRNLSYSMADTIDNVTLPDTHFAVQKNTTDGKYYLRVNDGGTIRSLGPFV